MKVQVNIINTRCITMSDAVAMPALMTSILSEESLARGTQTDRERHTPTQTVIRTHIDTDTDTQ